MRISNSCTIRRCGSGGHCAGQVSRCSVRHCWKRRLCSIESRHFLRHNGRTIHDYCTQKCIVHCNYDHCCICIGLWLAICSQVEPNATTNYCGCEYRGSQQDLNGLMFLILWIESNTFRVGDQIKSLRQKSLDPDTCICLLNSSQISAKGSVQTFVYRQPT